VSRWQWLIAALALVALLLIALAFKTMAQQPPPPLYEGITPDAGLLHLDERALDEAYHTQLVKLFGVWLSQGAPQDAANMRRGLMIARRAYGQAHQQIVQREKELRP
jgi:hypothetical protein